jgi:hypothetical protein
MSDLQKINIEDLKRKISEMTNEDVNSIEDFLNHKEESKKCNEKTIQIENDVLSETSETASQNINTVKNRIMKDIVVPNYYNDVKGTISSRKKWMKSSNITELLSKILTGLATIVAFSAGAYTDYTFLSFIAGCIGTVSLVCQQFSTYAKGEAKERTQQANAILKMLNIDASTVPDLFES